MLLIAAPYAALMVAVLCVYFSWRQLAYLVALVPVDLAALARAKLPAELLASELRPGTPLAELASSLAGPHAARARAVNEALLELGHALETNRRLPRVLASIGTSSCLLLAALVLRAVLISDDADLALDQGLSNSALGSALSVGLWGVFSAMTCIAIYARALRLEKELSRSVDVYVDAVENAPLAAPSAPSNSSQVR